ncbi:MAG: gamma carbonic anhydrase family protein, partial [Candidatus Nanohaloarchaea archaeon]|nr:gamma carbonic anhydrase family protein [Candidatus Nanohaloarchaea archaeon]
GKEPDISEDAFVHPESTVIGEVKVGKESSIWPSASVRGDSNSIDIGEETSVQDSAVIHTESKKSAEIGDRVTIGHNAIVHACKVEDEVLIGMGATVLSGAKIGKHSIIAAGALVPEGKEVPEGSVVMGVPGEVVRDIKVDDIQYIRENAQVYVEKAEKYQETMEEVNQ